MVAPRLEGLAFIFLAGIVVLVLGWFLAPPLLAFIIAFVVFDLSLAVSKIIAVWALCLWALGHLAVWTYTFIHDKIIANTRKRTHDDLM